MDNMQLPHDPIRLKSLSIKITDRKAYIEDPRLVPTRLKDKNIISLPPEFELTATMLDGSQVPVYLQRGDDMLKLTNETIWPEEIRE